MNDDAPLEWWEEIQLQILERLGEPVAHLRENPRAWRELRATLANFRVSAAEAARKRVEK